MREYCITLGGKRWADFRREFPHVVRFDGYKHKNGCTLSHLRLMRMATAEGHPAIKVFEDDARLSRNVAPEDQHAVDTFLADPQSRVLLLGYCPRVHDWTSGGGRLASGHALDTHAYVITAKGMADVLARFPSEEKFHCLWGMGAIDTYCLVRKVNGLVPPLYHQTGNDKYSHVPPLLRNAPQYHVVRLLNLAWFNLYQWQPQRLFVVVAVVAVVWAILLRRRR